MNERIKQLAVEAFFDDATGQASDQMYTFSDHKMQQFAELIVGECKENFAKVWYEQGLDIRGAELDKFMKRFDEHFGVDK